MFLCFLNFSSALWIVTIFVFRHSGSNSNALTYIFVCVGLLSSPVLVRLFSSVSVVVLSYCRIDVLVFVALIEKEHNQILLSGPTKQVRDHW